MAFGGFNSKSGQFGTVAEINMVPLIDVMLVLLIIFIITAPLMAHSIQINVPKVSSQPLEQKPEVIDVAVNANGDVYWNSELIPVNSLQEHMRQEAVKDPQPEIRIRADMTTEYGVIAQVMADAKKSDVKKLGFVTAPDTPPLNAKAPENGASTQNERAKPNEVAKPVNDAKLNEVVTPSNKVKPNVNSALNSS